MGQVQLAPGVGDDRDRESEDYASQIKPIVFPEFKHDNFGKLNVDRSQDKPVKVSQARDEDQVDDEVRCGSLECKCTGSQSSGPKVSMAGESFEEVVTGTAPASSSSQRTRSLCPARPWKSWEEVPFTPPPWAMDHQFFLEIFSGVAGISREFIRKGGKILPPIDIVEEGLVEKKTNIFDPLVEAKILNWLRSGAVKLVHFGTPCTTYSRARRFDGKGPPPLRSVTHLKGLPRLTHTDRQKVEDGDRCMAITAVWVKYCHAMKIEWTIENPWSSMIWLTPEFRSLRRLPGVVEVYIDMCMYGSCSQKPTKFLCSSAKFLKIGRKCCGRSNRHRHITLKGRTYDPVRRKWIFRTKLAQVYPLQLCVAYVKVAKLIMQFEVEEYEFEAQTMPGGDGSQFAESFGMVTPAAERKRPLHSPVVWDLHRQHHTGSHAISAGYQLKRNVVPKIFDRELEPGEAIKVALGTDHPFAKDEPLDPDMEAGLKFVEQEDRGVYAHRERMFTFWEARAEALRIPGVKDALQIEDKWLRALYLGNDPDPNKVDRPAGSFTNFLLWREIATHAQAGDLGYIDQVRQGIPIIGPIARSGRWVPREREEFLSEAELCERAWEIKNKIIEKVEKRGVQPLSKWLWEDMENDLKDGSAIGPFDQKEVDRFFDSDVWIPTPRFGIEQVSKVVDEDGEVIDKIKNRGVDSATENEINNAAQVTENIKLNSVDKNVTLIKKLLKIKKEAKISGWVVDESRAYRQIGIAPSHRRWSVICLFEPKTRKVMFFIMIGHSFGLVASVYNYNRRSAMINQILIKEFKLLAAFYFDDKFGFEKEGLVDQAMKIVQAVHRWVGAKFEEKKTQVSKAPTILGVVHDLDEYKIKIKPERKAALIDEIKKILEEGSLTPGHAGKLKGKLQFGAGQIWGKFGRAFLLALSERQYTKCKDLGIEGPIRKALEAWIRVLEDAKPREIYQFGDGITEAVIFTDGFFPDHRKKEEGPPRVGVVAFIKDLRKPLAITAKIDEEIMCHWIERKNQIAMVELFAPVLALAMMGKFLEKKKVLLFVDSEPVEGALVKGYSSRSDMCELTGEFWHLAHRWDIRIYIDRVPTDSNPSDGLSRNKLAEVFAYGWELVRDPVLSGLFSERKI